MAPFRWTERRVARFITILITAVVVIFDVVLIATYRRIADAFPPPWDRTMLFGIVGILLFALWRLRRQIRLFLQDR